MTSPPDLVARAWQIPSWAVPIVGSIAASAATAANGAEVLHLMMCPLARRARRRRTTRKANSAVIATDSQESDPNGLYRIARRSGRGAISWCGSRSFVTLHFALLLPIDDMVKRALRPILGVLAVRGAMLADPDQGLDGPPELARWLRWREDP